MGHAQRRGVALQVAQRRQRLGRRRPPEQRADQSIGCEIMICDCIAAAGSGRG